MSAIAQRRVAGATALMILIYLLQVALFAPNAGANEGNPPSVECASDLWNGKYYKLDMSGPQSGDGVINISGEPGDGTWTNGDTDTVFRVVYKVGQGQGSDLVYDGEWLPGEGDELLNPSGLSHVTWCFTDAQDSETPDFTVGACDDEGLRPVTFTVESGYEVAIWEKESKVLVGSYLAGQHSVDLAPGDYSWVFYELVGEGKVQLDQGSFTVDLCDADVTVDYGCNQQDVFVVTFSTSNASIAWTVDGESKTVVSGQSFLAGTVVSWTATADSGFEFGDDGDNVTGGFTAVACTTVTTRVTTTTQPTTTTTQPTTTTTEATTTTTTDDEVLGTTITTVPEVSADTLPFTGSESGDLFKLAMLALAAGALMLFAVRGPKEDDEVATEIGGWSSL